MVVGEMAEGRTVGKTQGIHTFADRPWGAARCFSHKK